MATDPSFAQTVNVGSGTTPATADSSLTAPTNVTTVLTAGANGTKIEDIVVVGVASTVAGLVNIFRYDGATYHLIDQIGVGAVTVGATTASFRQVNRYPNFWLKSGDTLRVSCTATNSGASLCKVTAFGGDF